MLSIVSYLLNFEINLVEMLFMFHVKESQPYNLRSQGLCLVPVSYTVGVASSNGADIWAPIKTSQKF